MKTPAKAAEVNTEPSVVTNGSAEGQPKQRIPRVPVELPDAWDSSHLDIQFGDFPPRPVEVLKESDDPTSKTSSGEIPFRRVDKKKWKGKIKTNLEQGVI